MSLKYLEGSEIQDRILEMYIELICLERGISGIKFITEESVNRYWIYNNSSKMRSHENVDESLLEKFQYYLLHQATSHIVHPPFVVVAIR